MFKYLILDAHSSPQLVDQTPGDGVGGGLMKIVGFATLPISPFLFFLCLVPLVFTALYCTVCATPIGI